MKNDLKVLISVVLLGNAFGISYVGWYAPYCVHSKYIGIL
jgi:hypothetical protein